MTKKSFTTVAVVGTLVLSSILSIAQTRQRAMGTSVQPGGAITPSMATGPAILPPPSYQPPQIIPTTKLPVEVRAYLSYTSTQALVGDLNTLVQQAALTCCATQLPIYQQAATSLSDATNQLAAALTEYNNQMALPQDQRDWTYFWQLIGAAYSDFNTASGYYNQALQTPC